MDSFNLPNLPSPVSEFSSYVSKNPNNTTRELVKPYIEYETKLRQLYAQEKSFVEKNPQISNCVSLYPENDCQVKVRARDLPHETEADKACYVMPLDDNSRRPSGSPAVVEKLKDFRFNFNLFSEDSLSELDWNNVVAAGSSVTTSLLPVPAKWADSKRTLRKYYHEILAPASDVDLFIYGLDEQAAIEKIKSIERAVKDSVLTEIT